MKGYSIQHIPSDDRPRERLSRHGPESLTAIELVAIILASGSKEKPVIAIAQELVARFANLRSLAEATLEELSSIKGVGRAKAMQLKAAMHLGLRASRETPPSKYCIDNPIQAYNLIKDQLQGETRELFGVILLDTRGHMICYEVVSIGTLSEAPIHPREVFYPAVRHKAASLILVHNHPSGEPTPSPDDYEITRCLIKIGDLMQIPVNDHIIVGTKSFTSMRQESELFKPLPISNLR